MMDKVEISISNIWMLQSSEILNDITPISLIPYWQCKRCDFATVQAGNLRRHLKTHSGEKPYKCQQCDLATVQACNLRRHLITHSREKWNQCDFTMAKKIEYFHICIYLCQAFEERKIWEYYSNFCTMHIGDIADIGWIRLVQWICQVKVQLNLLGEVRSIQPTANTISFSHSIVEKSGLISFLLLCELHDGGMPAW